MIRRVIAVLGWLCLIGAVSDAAVTAHLVLSGAQFEVPLGVYLSSGPAFLAAIGALLETTLPGSLWSAVATLPAGPFLSARMVILCVLALIAFVTARASRTRPAGR